MANVGQLPRRRFRGKMGWLAQGFPWLALRRPAHLNRTERDHPMPNSFAVFVKPWKNLALPELGRLVHDIGFDAVELPVRPGFACRPESIETDLPEAVRILADRGVSVLNVTADLALDDERLYAACAEAGVDLNRVMFRRGERNYWAAEDEARRQLDTAQPLCEQYHVRIGVQNHAGNFVAAQRAGTVRICSRTAIRAMSGPSGTRRTRRWKAWSRSLRWT